MRSKILIVGDDIEKVDKETVKISTKIGTHFTIKISEEGYILTVEEGAHFILTETFSTRNLFTLLRFIGDRLEDRIEKSIYLLEHASVRYRGWNIFVCKEVTGELFLLMEDNYNRIVLMDSFRTRGTVRDICSYLESTGLISKSTYRKVTNG